MSPSRSRQRQKEPSREHRSLVVPRCSSRSLRVVRTTAMIAAVPSGRHPIRGSALTRLLYYEDSSLREFEGTVQEVADRDGAIWVELDRTAFYPGGGGQPPDRGHLGDVPVTDVREEEGRLWHRIEGKLEARTPIRGALDWRRRFDHMQQHTGQHILSQAFIEVASAETRSFHLGEEEVSIDVAHPGPDPELLRRAEERARLLRELALEFTAGEADLPKAVARLKEEGLRMDRRLKTLLKAELEREAQALIDAAPRGARGPVIARHFPDREPAEIGTLAALISAKGGIALLVAGSDTPKAHFSAPAGTISVGDLLGRLARELGGKGGGRPESAQGAIPAHALEAALDAARAAALAGAQEGTTA